MPASSFGTEGNDDIFLQQQGFLGEGFIVETFGGNDNIRASELADIINAGDGNDRIVGVGGSDTINAGNGDDMVVAGLFDRPEPTIPETAIISLGAGLDRVEVSGSYGDVILDFNPAEDSLTFRGDIVNFSFPGPYSLMEVPFHRSMQIQGVLVSFFDGQSILLSGITVQQLINMENVGSAPPGGDIMGSNAPDFLTGTPGGDTISGGEGEDFIAGRLGNDLVFGGAGDDFLILDEGNDTLSGDMGRDVFEISPESGTSQDVIRDFNPQEDFIRLGRQYTLEELANEFPGFFSENREGTLQFSIPLNGGPNVVTFEGLTSSDLLPKTFIGTEIADTISGNQSANTLTGLSGNDTIFGFDGDDLIDGGIGRDLLWGGEGRDVLIGGADADHIQGEGGSDKIYAGSGNDKIYGQGGNDRIFGGTGKDTIFGGVGADTFVFSSANDIGLRAERDVIMDFQSGSDVIDLSSVFKGEASYINGSSFSGVAGQVRFDQKNAQVQGDLDGDRIIDFTLEIRGTEVLITDLIL